ncbi:hypothetical protein GQR58_021432 [Nymphon striatum]|nr:hypothetical protein GQR58_021432 [Nymphon striatum]
MTSSIDRLGDPDWYSRLHTNEFQTSSICIVPISTRLGINCLHHPTSIFKTVIKSNITVPGTKVVIKQFCAQRSLLRANPRICKEFLGSKNPKLGRKERLNKPIPTKDIV